LSKVYKVLDLFAGIGGLSYGFELVKSENSKSIFDIVCAVEIDGYACETLRKNLEIRGKDPEIVLQADLTEQNTHDLIIQKCKSNIDIIIGGPPCQSYSSIGTRSASKKIRNKFINDPRDKLYLEYISLVNELKPEFLVFENVRGILTKKDKKSVRYIDLVIDTIMECGYETCFENNYKDNYIILNSADYGVPQLRERVFILANKRGFPNPVPLQTHSEGAKIQGTLPYVTIRDAIGDLPPLLAPITLCGIPKEKHEFIKNKNKKRFRGEEKVPYHWEHFETHYKKLDMKGKKFLDFVKSKSCLSYLTAHVARGQQLSDIELFKKMPQGKTSKVIFKHDKYEDLRKLIKYDMNSFKDKYRKHSWKQPCTTVFAHMQKDGNRFIHPDSKQARTFSVREAARIQSFPDDFEFTAPGNVRYKHIGNAVPPLMGKAIGEAIYRSILDINIELSKQCAA